MDAPEWVGGTAWATGKISCTLVFGHETHAGTAQAMLRVAQAKCPVPQNILLQTLLSIKTSLPHETLRTAAAATRGAARLLVLRPVLVLARDRAVAHGAAAALLEPSRRATRRARCARLHRRRRLLRWRVLRIDRVQSQRRAMAQSRRRTVRRRVGQRVQAAHARADDPPPLRRRCMAAARKTRPNHVSERERSALGGTVPVVTGVPAQEQAERERA